MQTKVLSKNDFSSALRERHRQLLDDLLRAFVDAAIDIYVVGGAVRDYFCGLVPADIDFVTSRDAVDIIRLLHQTTSSQIQRVLHVNSQPELVVVVDLPPEFFHSF